MADFLETTETSHRLQQMLKNTKRQLILISPYLKLNERIKQELEDLDRDKIDIRLVYRENQLSPSEQNWLRSVPTIRTSFSQHLHAKCYVNESEAIITSMNLHEFSQVNNLEMGILVTKEQEPDLYAKVHEEAMTLVRISKEVRITVAEVPKTTKAKTPRAKNESGFCIHCHATLKLNPMVPYCKECYALWKKAKDNSQTERHCHICGKANDSSINRPACYSCYKSRKDDLEFPAVSSK